MSSADVFGKGFKAYLLGDSRNFLLLRDDGFEHEMEVGPLFTGFAEWARCEREVMEYVRK
jgi:hypothetical protein